MSVKKETTQVRQVEVNLDELLGMPGAESIMTPGEKKEEKKPGIFSSLNPDTSFLDKAEVDDDESNIDDNPDDDPANESDENDETILDPNLDNGLDEDDEPKESSKLGKFVKKLIDTNLLLPFDDDKAIEEYTEEDVAELFKANMEQYKKDLEESVPVAFLKALPDQLKYAYDYVANGGNDLKGLFRALAVSEEVQNLDITTDEGQKQTIRAYLQATRWGTVEEIEDEIDSLDDKGELQKKANQFKPKLDAMQQQIVEQKLLTQKEEQKKRANQSQLYIDSVYNTLEKGELNGLKLDNKIQNMLYTGLVQPNYPSMTGKQTNMFGHLLEKYQWVEPRHDLIAEALWLLADPDGYRKSVAQIIEKETVGKTVKTLKSEQSRKDAGGVEIDESSPTRNIKNIKKPKNNFFGR